MPIFADVVNACFNNYTNINKWLLEYIYRNLLVGHQYMSGFKQETEPDLD